MVRLGSVGQAPPLPWWLASLATALGLGAMSGTALVAWRLLPGANYRLLLVLAEAALVVPLLLLVLLRREPVRDGLGLVATNRQVAGIAVAAGATLWVASLGLLELQYAVWPPPDGYMDAFRRIHEMLKPNGPLDALVSIFAIAVAPAVCEEVLIRGALLPSLVKGLRPVGAVVASSLVFAFLHDAYRMPFTFAVGLALGALRLRSGSLLPTILSHASLNTLTFLAAPLVDDPTQRMPDPRPLLGAGLLAFGVIATLALGRRLPRR
jgi:membrane protease YdiL (CAAX protease family)